MVRKLWLIGGVGVVWLLTFLVMGGDLRPDVSLDSGPAATPVTSGPLGGPTAGSTPVAPATPTATADAATSKVAAAAEKLAGSKALEGPVLQARPKPRRSNPPVLQFRMASFNILGSSHTRNGGRNRASGTARAAKATQYVLDRNFSVVGFQEFQPDQRRVFNNSTGGRFGMYPDNQIRSQDGDNTIAWRKSEWDLVRAEYVQLPYFHGRPRYFPYILLRNKQTGISAWFSNFHNPANIGGNFARFREQSKVGQVKLFKELNKQGLPVFVTGDMNERRSWACQIVGPSDMRSASGGDGRDGCTVAGNEIDWITGSYDVGFSNYNREDNAFISSITDHPVIWADVKIDSRDFPRSVS